ncbi:aminoacyl-tRNA hydrolase [Kineosporia rhizophila]|uniref:aminoacyl-tRNA hydrolase n=1 Tax=Kineosporia TaxID=49184 RepID=UPI001E5FE918|nr:MULTISPECIES: aminoacyl-tRNA hydrolase [Kineosporia]MCE0535087.1 aminoacyl-tRNA hydrolase [Kineosporia rhizophila]GLY14629.1 peptidyl-tRNA hydrolase [Kineosporia sp. NBRC 101677]
MPAAPDPTTTESDLPWLVVGLGNPGDKYARNRHNVGHLVADEVVSRMGGRFTTHRARAQVYDGRWAPRGGRPGARMIVAKPSTYMNESGGPVAGLLKFFGLTPARLLVAHDELDIPFGELRLKWGGGEGGHNGLRSISKSTGSKDYGRLRLGVGRPPGRMEAADFVLRDFPSAQSTDVALMVGDAADAVEELALSVFARVQGTYNTQRS